MTRTSKELRGAQIADSDLILNGDGSIFHLHLFPEQVPETVILVGDPGRVAQVGQHLCNAEEVANAREFRAMLGIYHGARVLVQSTGIGAGCVDIVVNELDALVNIDLAARRCYAQTRRLRLVRIGTSGALHRDTANGEAIVTSLSIGFDSIPWLYAQGLQTFDEAAMQAFANAFASQDAQPPASLYAVRSDERLVESLAPLGAKGLTFCCPGFYGPQLRQLRLEPANKTLLEVANRVVYHGERVLNMEMESAPLNALASMLGHSAVTITLAIDNRNAETVTVDYQAAMDSLIAQTLDAILPA